MSTENNVRDYLLRDLWVFEDENNQTGSKRSAIWPPTILDQVFDDQTPDRRTLRQILEDLRYEIRTGAMGNIVFPVTNVNGKDKDVTITASDLNLGNVDNTRDIDKPLSDPQRASIMNILKEYDFNVDLSPLHEHILNTSNPHGVSIADIDKGGELEKYVQALITKHNFSTLDSTHIDIRRSLSNLWLVVDRTSSSLDDKIKDVISDLRSHMDGTDAHHALFAKKEDHSNKIRSFDTDVVIDHTHYPTTKAVSDFVKKNIDEFRTTIPDIQEWISNVVIVNSEIDLPEPTSRYYRSVYVIRYGPRSFSEVAVCKKKKDVEEYYWDITETATYSKYNKNHFHDTVDGLSLNVMPIVEEILNRDGVLDRTLKSHLSDYYTKKQIDDFHFVSDIKIIPGTMDGTIRYYINDDMKTMSTDVRVAGLQRLAFMEYINEDQIKDNSIHSRHILNQAIITRHIKDGAVSPIKIACKPGHILANFDDDEGYAHEYTFKEFVDKLGLTIGGNPNPPDDNEWIEIPEITVNEEWEDKGSGPVEPADEGEIDHPTVVYEWSDGGSGDLTADENEITDQEVRDTYENPDAE